MANMAEKDVIQRFKDPNRRSSLIVLNYDSHFSILSNKYAKVFLKFG